eukprot:TRINITY_DN2505_c0_g1_i1.p1 TRINITY_DN2505_c0_g1~~TRINITY_DN2505_c0_g1_i1.p1  ORF type:complete len:1331 (+),score=315.55 TRINITY_DN2505_c0_g1_i1:86-4078(+)
MAARTPLINGADADGPQFTRTLSERAVSAETLAGPIGFLSFGWFTPIIDLAFQRNQQGSKLEPTDLYPLPAKDTSSRQFERLNNNWQYELSQDEPSLMRALRKTFFREVLATAWIQLVSTSLQFVSPLLLHKILNFVQNPDSEAKVGGVPVGYLYAVGMVTASFVQGCLSAHYFQMGYRNGMHIRAALILLSFHKALRILPWSPPPPAAPPAPTPEELRQQQRRCCKKKPQAPRQLGVGGMGQMTNIISSDTDKFTFLMPYFNVMWSGALQITIAFTMLYAYVSWALFAGVVVMISFTMLSGYIQAKAKSIQARVMAAKDERLKMEVEMLKIVKVIKLYAWETTIERKVKELRDKELRAQLKFKMVNVFIFISFQLSPVLVSLATFSCYTGLLGKKLDAETAFPALSLFNILRFPLALMPMVLGFYQQALVAKDRMQAFYLAPEVAPRPLPPPTQANAVELKADLVWPDSTVLLSNVNFSVKKGETAVVVGKTGAGKSGLLYALLGELPIAEASGKVFLSGSVGYCAQSAWVRNASLKNNITWGVLDEDERYEAVLDACALRPDLATLPDGDQTMIGDRGINLSGGQKQRVALARAVFADKDIYVLDDVLSALDGHVTNHICQKLFNGPLMRGKTVVLVTHSRRAMQLADSIYAVADKSMQRFSSFEEFRAAGVVDQLDDKEEKEDEPVEEKTPTEKKKKDDSDGKSETKKVAKPKATLQAEQRRAGSVSGSVYLAYMRACGGVVPCGWFMLTIAMSEGSKNMSDVWLSKWTKDGGEASGSVVYALIALCSAVLAIVYSTSRIFLGQRGSRTLHEKCVHSLLRATMNFYDKTPNGQILNRLAEDTVILDSNLPQTMAANLVWYWKAGAIVVMCMLVGWYLVALMIPMFLLYSRMAKRYLPAVRDLRRLDAAAKSPIFSHFSETMAGVTTIRAMQEQDGATSTNMANLESQMEAYFLNNTAARWLSLRLQCYGTLLVGTVCLVGVYLSTNKLLGAGVLGLAITYAMNLSDTLAQVNRESADRETQMVSVERLHNYATELEQEDVLVEPTEARPPASFMKHGEVSVENVTMKYREDLPVVLDGITLKIKQGERVGIVGRTGCGKSSFLSTLMRLVECQGGRFCIDDVDLKTVGLHTLRSKVAIIPQDPAILTGTVRFNLDPFGEFEDGELLNVLDKVQLKERVTPQRGTPNTSPETPDDLRARELQGLDSIVQEGGGNYSVGELQLLCMARALLRRRAFAGGGLLLLDEATSALDSTTDDIIQKIIRQDFSCTTITIAHRIQTLMDYDRVVVLRAGKVLEFDTPAELLKKPSEFRSLAQEGGVDVAKSPKSS